MGQELLGTRAEPASPPGAGTPRTRLEVLTTEEQVRAIAPAWEALKPHPNADPEFFLTIIRARPEVISPYVFALFEGEVLVALLAGRLEKSDFRSKIGGRTVHRSAIRLLTLVHGGALRARPELRFEPLLEALRAALRSGVAHAAGFGNVESPSDLETAIRAVFPRSLRASSAQADPHWFLELPPTFDELLARVSGRVRNTLKRRRKVLERDFPGQVTIRRTREPGEVADFCRRAEVLAARTYQRGLGVGFAHTPEFETRLLLAARRGRLRAYELEVDGALRAYWIGELGRGEHHLASTGFEKEFGRYAPGTVIRLEVLRDSIEEGIRGIDFGFGDADYKREFDAKSRRECDHYAFAPGLRGRWLAVVRRGVSRLERIARAIVAKLRLEARLKKAMRRSAAERTESAEEPEES